MEWKSAIKRLGRPASQTVTRVVNRAVGSRLANLEHAHGVTWLDVQSLKAAEPPDARLDAVEAQQQDLLHEVEELRASIAGVFEAVSRQHAMTRGAVRAEKEMRQVAEELYERLDKLEQRAEAVDGPS